ncbi:MFS transporter [Candidatus Lokiarchaeum ossiferum]|uniref:MFS transporter n=1 Tax=Candidatus Lokiarchaeum ossiferum TaxID=2951803 RepID=UPI00352BF2B3
METYEGKSDHPIVKSKVGGSRMFIGLSSFQMLAMFRRGLFYTFLSIYMRYYLELTVTQTTLYATLPMVASSICQMFVWGRISDRLQKRRTLIIIGEVIAGILLLITFWVHRAFDNLTTAGFVIIIGLTVIEVFWSMSNIGWSALVSDLYPSKERSRVMAQLTSIGGIGRILGIFLGGFLYEGFFTFNYEGWGFREGILFYLAAAAMFLSTLPMIFMVPEGGVSSKIDVDNASLTEPQLHVSATDKQNSKENSSRLLIIFVIFIISMVFINFGRNSVAVTYSQYLNIEGLFSVDVNSRMISYIANVRSFATILVGIFAGRLSKKFGHGITLLIGSAMALFYLFLTAIGSQLWIIFFGSFLAGASEVIIMAAAYAFAADLIPETRRAKLFGIYNATFFLSWGLASTLVTGPLVDSLISQGNSDQFAYQAGFYVGMAITFVGMLIFGGLLFYKKKKMDIINE